MPNSAFTASSESPSYSASQGRLGNRLKAWIPQNFQPPKIQNTRYEYLQVDLGKRKTVTAVSTEGLTSGKFYVTEFELSFSQDGDVFDHYLHAKAPKVGI